MKCLRQKQYLYMEGRARAHCVKNKTTPPKIVEAKTFLCHFYTMDIFCGGGVTISSGGDGGGRVQSDNFRMNTCYGRYGAAYNMVGLRCFNEELSLLPKNPTEAKLQAMSTPGESTEPT